MTEKERIKYYFNEVRNLTAVCRSNICWLGDYRELKVGQTYRVTHIGVLRSTTKIMLAGYNRKEYHAGGFDIYENGVNISETLARDNRFLAPYLRKYINNYFDNEYTMNKAIPEYLKAIEKDQDVKILLAVESGSRAWGFESKDSDWDVRFIYVHKPQWYFKVDEQRDVIEHVFEGQVDMVGWELRKALSLLKRSNPSLLEWFNAPIKYYVNEAFAKRIHKVEKVYFNPVKTMYHYNHIYNKHNERYLKHEGYSIKVFLYYLRGILACKWIEKNLTLPPVCFKELLDATVDDQEIIGKVDDLILVKKGLKECDFHVVDKVVADFAKKWADYYNEIVDTFRPEQNSFTTDALDAILYDMVNSKP